LLVLFFSAIFPVSLCTSLNPPVLVVHDAAPSVSAADVHAE
jgi:hypothetical protein